MAIYLFGHAGAVFKSGFMAAGVFDKPAGATLYDLGRLVSFSAPALGQVILTAAPISFSQRRFSLIKAEVDAWVLVVELNR